MNDLAHITAVTLGDVSLVRISGEIDLSNANDIGDAIAAAVPGTASRVVVDLSRTAYLDSTGIAMLFRLAERLGHQRQELRLVVPRGSVIRPVLDLTKVSDVIPIDERAPARPEQIGGFPAVPAGKRPEPDLP